MTSTPRLCLAAALLALGVFPARSVPISTNAAANLVIGQTLFTTNSTPVQATGTNLRQPTGVAVDATTGKVFVADWQNNRVLRYASETALANGAGAELVIGQINFSSDSANLGSGPFPVQTSIDAPVDLFVDASGNLWVADTGNNRVLMYANAANLFNNPAAADRVFGQPDFSSFQPGTTQTKLSAPRGVCVDANGTLWVADTGNHRVLGWLNAATIGVNGYPAYRVLGQANFTTATAATTQKGMSSPSGVAANGTQLWVADTGNNRVLFFANYPSVDDAPAGLVLGQANYTSATAGTSATALSSPTSVALSGADLWVADAANNRVLFFPSALSLSPGGAATVVVGQAGLTTGTPGTASQKLSLQTGHLSVDAGGNLFVADDLNNRVLRFGGTSVTPTPTPGATPTPTPSTVVTGPATIALTGKSKIITHNYFVNLKGTAAASSGIRRVSWNLNNQGYLRAQGTTSWKAKVTLPFGRSKIIINSVALDGTVSRPLTIIVTRE